MEFEKKTLNNHAKNMDFLNNLAKTPVARKLAVRHTKLVCLTTSFLATGGFNYFKCMQGLQVCLFKFITVAAFQFILSVVKMLLKAEVEAMHLRD